MPTTKKPIVSVVGGTQINPNPAFTVTPESKKKAFRLRILSFVLWILAIGCEALAFFAIKNQQAMAATIVYIVVDLALAIIASLIWKHAQRLDPPSRSNGVSFFLKSQLGLIMAVIAFLPLIIFVMMDKNIDPKSKGIITAVAAVALIAAGSSGANYNPPSIEQYAEQTAQVNQLMGEDLVYFTKSGTHYHLFSDCSSINTDKTEGIFQGTVAQARELKHISELCKICENKAVKNDRQSLIDETQQLEDAAAEQAPPEQSAA